MTFLIASFNVASASITGVSSDVKGNVSDVKQNTQAVFKDMGIAKTGSSIEQSGKQQTLKGKKGGTEVTVTMKEAGSNTTHVDVAASEGALKWNKDYAQNVLSKIIDKS